MKSSTTLRVSARLRVEVDVKLALGQLNNEEAFFGIFWQRPCL